MREEMTHKIESIKNELLGSLQEIRKNVDEKTAAMNKTESETLLQTNSQKSFLDNPDLVPLVTQSLEDRITVIERNLAKVTAQVNEIAETLSDPENRIDERIAAVLEERLEQRKEIVTVSKGPKWIISEAKCKELHKYSQGLVGRFLTDYLPLIYDLSEIITPFKSDEKGEEVRAVIDHFWNGSLTKELCIKEIEKEHANQRYKLSRKIYQGLKNSAGCIMSKTGLIYECNWDDDKRKFIPKLGESVILRPQQDDDDDFKVKKTELEWSIPKDIYKETFDRNDYMIIAKNDDLNQTRISKIDLETLEIQMLYTKRKYGNT
uniref:Uncharacterized protein n=1 Tax=Panagrolaimus davidi TaxID=227884 RepID=A0A914P7Q3_9BILA